MTDIVIVGGGIAGMSAAAELAGASRVTLLEAERQLGHHASGRSAAAFLEDYGNATVRALNRASRPALDAGGFLSPRGMLLVGRAADAKAFAEEARTFSLVPLTPAEAARKVPILATDVVAFAGWRDDIFDLDTDALLQACRRRALRGGARICTGAAAERIERIGPRWRVHAGGEAHEADILVNAAGAWADEVARLAGVAPIGIRPFRRSIAVLPAPEGQNVDSWPFVIAAGERWFAKPQAGRLLVSPADEDPAEPHDAWADDLVLAEGLHRFEEMVTVPVTRVEGSWAGLRSFAPDRALVIGPDPLEPRFLWCAGQGGYGFQTAPAAARLLADHALSRRPELAPGIVAALSPARFRQGRQDRRPERERAHRQPS